jgi:8-oxo-dGTP diphosphatase
MLDEERFSIAAYAVIQNDRDEVLLTRRSATGEWVLPGGSVEGGEAPWEALVREVCEETGLEAAITRLTGVYAKRREGDLVFVFAAAATGGELRPSDERDRVEFLDPHEFPAGTSERDGERVADALSGRGGPVLATQPSEGEEPPAGTR